MNRNLTLPRQLRVTLTTVLALVVMGGIAGAATAASFSISPSGEIEAISQGLITFEEEAGLTTVTCSITLTGGLHNHNKVNGATVATISAFNWSPCTGGELSTGLNVNTWRMLYNGILGTLPENVTGMLLRFINYEILYSSWHSGVNCLFAGELPVLLRLTRIAAATYHTGILSILQPNLLTRTAGMGCPSGIRVSGTYAFSPTRTWIRA